MNSLHTSTNGATCLINYSSETSCGKKLSPRVSADLMIRCSSCSAADPNQTVVEEQRTDWMMRLNFLSRCRKFFLMGSMLETTSGLQVRHSAVEYRGGGGTVLLFFSS